MANLMSHADHHEPQVECIQYSSSYQEKSFVPSISPNWYAAIGQIHAMAPVSVSTYWETSHIHVYSINDRYNSEKKIVLHQYIQ